MIYRKHITTYIVSLLFITSVIPNCLYGAQLTIHNHTNQPLTIEYKALKLFKYRTFKKKIQPGQNFTKTHLLSKITDIAIKGKDDKDYKAWVRSRHYEPKKYPTYDLNLTFNYSVTQCYGPTTRIKDIDTKEVMHVQLYTIQNNDDWKKLKKKTAEIGLCPPKSIPDEFLNKKYSNNYTETRIYHIPLLAGQDEPEPENRKPFEKKDERPIHIKIHPYK